MTTTDQLGHLSNQAFHALEVQNPDEAARLRALGPVGYHDDVLATLTAGSDPRRILTLPPVSKALVRAVHLHTQGHPTASAFNNLRSSLLSA